MPLQNTTVTILSTPSKADWEQCKLLTLGTMSKQPKTPVTEAFKNTIIKSEHSPIYTLMITWEWVNLPSWVSVHFVRHHVGITHFVSSQRNDRQDQYDRNAARQDAPVLHRCTASFQTIINMSKMRLCQNASPETREAWLLVLKELKIPEPTLVKYCVAKCIYRNGICCEPKQCRAGVNSVLLSRYRKLFNEEMTV